MPLPQEGGCWFCSGDAGEMAFSTEFDCWLHMSCLAHAIRVDPLDPEARIMARELGGGLLPAEEIDFCI